MKLLSKITPAETILIRDGAAAQLKDLMKYTFMDLVLKKVIEIKEINKKSHPRDNHVSIYTYVVSGKNFSRYRPKNHELPFLSPFIKSQSIKILFKHFIKMAYDASNGSWEYQKKTRSNLEINQYFKETFISNLFRIIKLTDKGIHLRNKISNYLKQIDRTINNLLKNDNKKGLELLLSLGGNIFLLKKFDFKLLKKIDKELLKHQRVMHSDDSESDWWMYMDFFEDDYLIDSYFDSFDSFDDTLDSFDSEFDASGCSSCDSGCNSCGGCD